MRDTTVHKGGELQLTPRCTSLGLSGSFPRPSSSALAQDQDGTWKRTEDRAFFVRFSHAEMRSERQAGGFRFAPVRHCVTGRNPNAHTRMRRSKTTSPYSSSRCEHSSSNDSAGPSHQLPRPGQDQHGIVARFRDDHRSESHRQPQRRAASKVVVDLGPR